MEFYQQCFGGELSFQTLGASPKTGKLPDPSKKFIVQASLKNENLKLMGTDMSDEKLLRGNSVSILLDCDNEERIKTYYQSLATGGKASHPLQETHWGDIFGGLTDRYGNNWLFQCNRNHSKIKENGKFKIHDGG
jgi:PhnB protein